MGHYRLATSWQRLSDGTIFDVIETHYEHGTARGETELKDPMHRVKFELVNGQLLVTDSGGDDLVDPATSSKYRFADIGAAVLASSPSSPRSEYLLVFQKDESNIEVDPRVIPLHRVETLLVALEGISDGTVRCGRPRWQFDPNLVTCTVSTTADVSRTKLVDHLEVAMKGSGMLLRDLVQRR